MVNIRLYDVKKCIGCRACEVACISAHDGNGPYIWVEDFAPENTPGGLASLFISAPERAASDGPERTLPVPVSCTHCHDAPCVKACPTGAMHFEDRNLVLIEPRICIGCKYCSMACPYGVIDYNPKLKVVQKCDLCRDRRLEGLLPACVATCPTSVIQFVEESALPAP